GQMAINTPYPTTWWAKLKKWFREGFDQTHALLAAVLVFCIGALVKPWIEDVSKGLKKRVVGQRDEATPAKAGEAIVPAPAVLPERVAQPQPGVTNLPAPCANGSVEAGPRESLAGEGQATPGHGPAGA